MPSRDLNDLHPAHEELCAWLIREAKTRLGITIRITCTYRSGKEQDALYAQSRTAPGPRVTNARAGQSAHNTPPERLGDEGAAAFDFVVIDAAGQPDWGSIAKYVAVANLAREAGAECGAFWPDFRDYPHVQMPDWSPGKRYGKVFRYAKLAPEPPHLEPKPPTEELILFDPVSNTPIGEATRVGGKAYVQWADSPRLRLEEE